MSFCPRCGHSLEDPRSFVQELWVGPDTVHYCWCVRCGSAFDVVRADRVVAHEAVG